MERGDGASVRDNLSQDGLAWYTRKDGPMTAREVEDAQDFGEIHGYAAICGMRNCRMMHREVP
jgi:hypothetical protein